MLGFSCGMRDLVLWTGTEPGPAALGAWRLSHWTIREVPVIIFFNVSIISPFDKAIALSLPQSGINQAVARFPAADKVLEPLVVSFWLSFPGRRVLKEGPEPEYQEAWVMSWRGARGWKLGWHMWETSLTQVTRRSWDRQIYHERGKLEMKKREADKLEVISIVSKPAVN